MRTALTIAGSDPSGGAGIQADLRTFATCGVAGASAITAVTVQNSKGVHRVFALAPDLVAAQIDAVTSDVEIDATKIGMLANAEIVRAVAEVLGRRKLRNVVLDPVLTATAGGTLLNLDAIARLVAELLPLAAVVTPNVPELQTLTQIVIDDVGAMREGVRRLVTLGARAVIAKGGHLNGRPVDVVYDGQTFTEIDGDRVTVGRTHGTGCLFSSAVAACLARGDSLVDGARTAKKMVAAALVPRT